MSAQKLKPTYPKLESNLQRLNTSFPSAQVDCLKGIFRDVFRSLENLLQIISTVVNDNASSLDTLTAAALQNTAALGNYANDTAAAAGGVPLHGFYRNGNAVQQRIT